MKVPPNGDPNPGDCSARRAVPVWMTAINTSKLYLLEPQVDRSVGRASLHQDWE